MLDKNKIAIKGNSYNIKKLLKNLKSYKLILLNLNKYNNIKNIPSDILNYKKLLSEDGFLMFVLDIEHIHDIKNIMKETFHDMNYINTFILNKKDTSSNGNDFIEDFKFVFLYGNSKNSKYKNISKRECMGWIDLMADDNYEETNKVYTYKMDKCYNINNTKWKWSEKRFLRAIDNYNDYLRIHNKDMTLNEYWEQNKEDYQIKNKFELEFAHCNSNIMYYYDMSHKPLTTNLSHYYSEEKGLLYIIDLILTEKDLILTNKKEILFLNEILVKNYNETFILNEDENISENFKNIFNKFKKEIEIIELIEN